MWDLPGPGLEPVSPALAGGFFTTAPQGKSRNNLSNANPTASPLCLKHFQGSERPSAKYSGSRPPHSSSSAHLTLAWPCNASRSKLVPLNIPSCLSLPWLLVLSRLPGLTSPPFRSVHYPVSFLRAWTHLSYLCRHTFSTGLGISDRTCYPEKSALDLLREGRTCIQLSCIRHIPRHSNI